VREIRSAYEILTGKSEGKRPLRRPRHRREDIKMDLKEIRWEDVDWIHQAQDRDWWWALGNKIINL
jgi:hypothetical protein